MLLMVCNRKHFRNVQPINRHKHAVVEIMISDTSVSHVPKCRIRTLLCAHPFSLFSPLCSGTAVRDMS